MYPCDARQDENFQAYLHVFARLIQASRHAVCTCHSGKAFIHGEVQIRSAAYASIVRRIYGDLEIGAQKMFERVDKLAARVGEVFLSLKILCLDERKLAVRFAISALCVSEFPVRDTGARLVGGGWN